METWLLAIAMCLYRFVSVTHFVIQVEVIEHSVGAEAVCVLVQGEIDAPAVAFYLHSVPVIVVKETTTGHSCVALDGAILIAS